MTLHTKILDAARDEVAIKHADDWEQRVSGYNHWVERYSPGEKRLLSVEKEAALLAMEKQDKFHKWAMLNWWEWYGESWEHKLNGKDLTELELYEIWEGQKK